MSAGLSKEPTRELTKGDARRLLWNALATALLAAIVVQAFHELVHGLLAEAGGADFVRWNLFAAFWEGSVSPAARALIAGGAPTANILTGLAALWLGATSAVKRRGGLHLFLFHFAALSLLTGFGYFLKDAAFYVPGRLAGDIAVVLDYLGGSWLWRGLFILLGAGGWIWTFFQLGGRVQRLTPVVENKTQRLRVAGPLLLTPYLAVGVLFTLLGLGHPLGFAGFVLTALQYWLGYSGLFWAFLQAVYWRKPSAEEHVAVELPLRIRRGWLIAAVVALAAAVVLLLPGLNLA